MPFRCASWAVECTGSYHLNTVPIIADLKRLEHQVQGTIRQTQPSPIYASSVRTRSVVAKA
jgi:hypothetical protein